MGTPRRAREKRWSKTDTVLLLLIVLVAGGVRILRLAEPDRVVFDETYYAKDACLYLGHSQDFCGLDQSTEQSYVHPPLGKWLISLGIAAFGYNSFGWRFSAAVFGTAMAAVAFLLARRLFKDRWTAGVAGLLTAVDLLLIVQSRIAMLDIFLAFFVLLGFLFLALDRDRVVAVREALETKHVAPGRGNEERSSALLEARDQKEYETLLNRRAAGPVKVPKRGLSWRLAAGLALGLAVAVKWSALLALAAVAACAFLWSLDLLITDRKHRSGSGRRAGSAGKELGASILAFALVPAVVYIAGYGAYFVDRYGADCPYTVPADGERLFDATLLREPEGKCISGTAGTLISFADLQHRMLDYHANLTAEHSYQSRAWTWPLLLRPVAYHFESEQGKATEVMAVGNVAAWYGSLLALGWLVPKSFRRWRPERLVVLGWAVQYLPWLLVPRPLFLFYMTPVVPFMAIGLAAALSALRRRGRVGRFAVWLFLFASAVLLAMFYPVVAAVPLPQDWWRKLMWIPQFDCGGFMCGWI